MRGLIGAVLTVFLALATPSLAAPRADAAYLPALDAAVRDLCGKDVALLGENGFHGDGQTVAFKAALIERLVRQCRFNAVFFEASHYDFLELERKVRVGEPISEAMVSSGIGWLWNHDEELSPLIPFLTSQVQARRIVLGGLDNQLGGRGEFYGLEQMPADLAGYLPPERREVCRSAMRRRIWSDYPAASPYDLKEQAVIQRCLGDVRAAIGSAAPPEHLRMVLNFESDVARDFAPETMSLGRDRMMFTNFEWLAGRLPPHSKIIVWAATVHIAKDSTASAQFPTGGAFGAYLHKAYGDRAFALGFSAGGGSYRYSSREARPIPPALAGSLEARVLGGGADVAAYVGPRRLRELGVVPGALFDHKYAPARWADVVDGVVVFRAERPPVRTDAPAAR